MAVVEGWGVIDRTPDGKAGRPRFLHNYTLFSKCHILQSEYKDLEWVERIMLCCKSHENCKDGKIDKKDFD